MSTRPFALPPRVTFIAALVASVAALVLPWFSEDQWSGDKNTTEHWWLWGERHCSDFARDAVECRMKILDIEVDWLLVPLFVLSRAAVVAAAVFLFVAAWRRSPRLWRAGAIAFLVFVVHIAASPGDGQYNGLSLWLGAYLALAGAAIAALDGLALRRDVVLALVGALITLWSSLWLPWAMEPEAVSPANPDEQSAFSYGTIARRHHWHDFKASREHYLEDAIDENTLAEMRARDLAEYAPPFLAAVLGVALAALLYARARGDTRDAWRVAAGIAFLVFGASILRIALTMTTLWPGPGALLAIVVVAGVVVDAVLNRRDDSSLRDRAR